MARVRTLEDLKARTTDDAGCWVWQGMMTAKGTVPTVKINNKALRARYVALELSGANILPGRCMVAGCGNKRCINPEHTVQLTRAQLATRNMRNANQYKLRAARARVARERFSTLTIEDVRDIRLSGLPTRELMAKYEISKTSVCDIRRGDRWRDYENPFAQLIG